MTRKRSIFFFDLSRLLKLTAMDPRPEPVSYIHMMTWMMRYRYMQKILNGYSKFPWLNEEVDISQPLLCWIQWNHSSSNWDLSNLLHLDLGGDNYTGKITHQIGNLTKLLYLYLSNDYLYDDMDHEIPMYAENLQWM